MAKRLTTQDKIKRLRGEGYSRKQLAESFGVSVSAIGRAERGQTSGDTFADAVSEFFKLGKRAKANVVEGSVSLPSAKPKKEPKREEPEEPVVERIVTPLEKAEGVLTQLDGDMMVVIHVTLKSTGMSRTLFATGGVEVDYLRQRGLKRAIEDQFGKQYKGGGLNWDDVVDITIEEY